MLCPSCNHFNEDGVRYCTRCRSALEFICFNCGERIRADRDVCDGCGSSIELLHSSPSVWSPDLVKPLAKKVFESRVSAEGERKFITVLFADIKGSTSHIEHLDPEMAMKLLDHGLKAMTGAVHQYGGTVIRVDGDGILALFGAPEALEDHAARACHAAIEMHERVRHNPEWDILLRVGIDTGEVIVDFIETDFALAYRATGLTVHMASRLEGLSKPGSVFVTRRTFELAKDYVEARSLGTLPIRGVDEKVSCFEILQRKTPESRWATRSAVASARFFGRGSELQVAADLAQAALKGNAQVLAIVGDPGVGKSRLAREIACMEPLAHWCRYETSAPPFGKQTTYLPVAGLLRSWFNIHQDEDPGSAVAKVKQHLQELEGGPRRRLPALASLLDLPINDEDWERTDPEVRRRQMGLTLVELIRSSAAANPLLLIFEDLQWMDVESQALLQHIVTSLGDARVLLLLTYRPDEAYPWERQPQVRVLQLGPLDDDSAKSLVNSLMGDQEEVSTVQRILEWTGGVPLFIEEIVRTLTSNDGPDQGMGVHRKAATLDKLIVPATIHGLIAERVDRLSARDKYLLQIASVIGVRVHIPLLTAVAEMPAQELKGAIDMLAASGFLAESTAEELKGAIGMRATSGFLGESTAEEETITFRHALIHETVYGSLLKERRRLLHGRISRAIEQRYAGRVESYVEQIALHAWLGEDWARSAEFYSRAAERASERSAYAQAIEFFKQGLAAIAKQPSNANTIQQRIDIELALRRIYGAMGESSRAIEDLDDLQGLAHSINDYRRLTDISTYKAIELSHQGVLDAAILAGKEAYQYAEHMNDVPLLVNAAISLGLAYYHHGDYREVTQTLGKVIPPLDDPDLGRHFGAGTTMSVRCLGVLTGSLAALGEFAPAQDYGEQALKVASAADRPIDIGTACYFLGITHLQTGETEAAIEVLERGYEACKKGHVRYMLPWLATELGLGHVLRLGDETGIILLSEAIEQCSAMNLLFAQTRARLRMAEASITLGRSQNALRHAQAALNAARDYRYRGLEARALRLSGETKAAGADQKEGESELQRSRAMAESLGMLPDVAHAHHQLGLLHHAAAQFDEARIEHAKALSIYARLGMRRYAERVQTLLGGRSAGNSA